MTGSNLAVIVIPIVVMFGLAAWIVMVFYASSHPLWKNSTAAAQNKAPARPSRQVQARSGRRISLPPVTRRAASVRHG